MSDRDGRVIAIVVYFSALLIIQWFVVDAGFPINEKLLWLCNGLASLLLGSRLLNPHFVPSADAATNSFVAGATIVAALAADSLDSFDRNILGLVAILCAATLIAAFIVLIVKKNHGLETRRWVLALEKGIKSVGDPQIIFTIVITCLTWVFHRDSAAELFFILVSWTSIVALKPVESILKYIVWVSKTNRVNDVEALGVVAAYQSPGLVLMRQYDTARHAFGTLMVLSDEQGPSTLGVALNYVGRDEGILLRLLRVEYPDSLQDQIDRSATGRGLASAFDRELTTEIPELDRIEVLCGIVDSESDHEFIQIEIVREIGLCEGCLLEVSVGAEDVMYQVVSGLTREDIVQRKNRHGYITARARKIGRWSGTRSKFEPVSWLPNINTPVFMKRAEEFSGSADAIGHFPDSNYHVSINVGDAVTHNTAILGILGIGKSFLAIEIAERIIRNNTKIICLDLTDQYLELLAEFWDEAYQQEVNETLREAATGRTVSAGKDDGGSIGEFNKKACEVIESFLAPATPQQLLIFNPASFRVSKQTTGMFNGVAGFSDLTPPEIVAIFSSAALRACQAMGMTTSPRACLIYEEAHSLVPEWNSVASDGDKNATAASARAILQGRKYGLGCLLITQRTANVTKTILNQCNSIFAMRTFDDTGKEFLGNYIGREYASVLPSLKERHAVFFGKASSCDDPVMIRLNDREDFIKAFRPTSSTAG